MANATPIGKQVNRVGKYIYSKFDSKDSIKFEPNMCKVYFTIYYQLPKERQNPQADPEVNDMHEMQMCINITTYSNKLRVEINEISPHECTISFAVYDENIVQNLELVRAKILNKLRKDICKRYMGYDFIF